MIVSMVMAMMIKTKEKTRLVAAVEEEEEEEDTLHLDTVHRLDDDLAGVVLLVVG